MKDQGVSLISKTLELLNLKVDEIFKIKGDTTPFKITEEGKLLRYDSDVNKWKPLRELTLIDLLAEPNYWKVIKLSQSARLMFRKMYREEE